MSVIIEAFWLSEEWTIPPIKPTRVVMVIDPIVVNLQTGEIALAIQEVLAINPIAINFKTGEVMVAIQ